MMCQLKIDTNTINEIWTILANDPTWQHRELNTERTPFIAVLLAIPGYSWPKLCLETSWLNLV